MEQISDNDAKLYDRQIRLWGAASQQKIFGARVLVVGLDGVGAEVVKNLVLAGVGHLQLCDGSAVGESDLGANFLLARSDLGANRAAACLPRVRELNPRVSVEADARGPAALDAADVAGYAAVVCCSANLLQAAALGEIVRSGSQGVFFAASGWGRAGFVFCDASNHTFRAEGGGAAEEQRVPPQEPLGQVARRAQPPGAARGGAATAAGELWLLWRFQLAHGGRRPGLANEAALAALCGEGPGPDAARTAALAREASTQPLAPVCAVLGGVAAQHVLRALTRVGRPLEGLFVFDGRAQVVGQVLKV
jgi:ubiquitin-like 1-activating enzyme E1 A